MLSTSPAIEAKSYQPEEVWIKVPPMSATPPGLSMTNNFWQPDDSTERCERCEQQFSMLLRKHHCRHCLKIFCWKCSNRFGVIPSKLLFNSDQEITKTQQRLCENCYILANLIQESKANALYNPIVFFVTWDIFKWLNLNEICLLKCTHPSWRVIIQWVLENFSKQVHPDGPLGKIWDTNELDQTKKVDLWNWRKVYSKHTRWSVLIIKHVLPWIIKQYSNGFLSHETISFLKSCGSVKEKKENYNNHKACKSLLCGMGCKPHLGFEELLELLPSLSSESLELLLEAIEMPTKGQVVNSLPLLLHAVFRTRSQMLTLMIREICQEDFIHNILIGSFCLDIRWLSAILEDQQYPLTKEQKIKTSDGSQELFVPEANEMQATHAVLEFQAAVKSVFDVISSCNKNLDQIKPKINDMWGTLSSKLRIHTLISIHRRGKASSKKNVTKVRFNSNACEIVPSASRPFVGAFSCIGNDFRVLFKTRSVVKDYVVLNLIRLSESILEKELGMKFELITYQIVPVMDKTYGLIEIIPNAVTLQDVSDVYNTDLLSWIQNRNRGLSIKELRMRFGLSASFWCTFCYMLNLSDRHLNNVLISHCGRMFEVDFESILQEKTSLMEYSAIRITHSMEAMLGGAESIDFLFFKDTCLKVYNSLRKHFGLFASAIEYLIEQKCLGLELEVALNRLKTTFKPSLPDRLASLTFTDNLEKSRSSYNSYSDSISDLLHQASSSIRQNVPDLSSISGLLSWRSTATVTQPMDIPKKVKK